MSVLADHVEKELLFKSRYPELAFYFPELMGVFVRSVGRLPDDLESMRRHVFADPWCVEEFENLRRFKDSFC